MSDERKGAGSGLSVQTLVISSLSAVAATLIVSQFWESGTLVFTAMVPIVVALVSEALKRPAEKITQVAPLVVSTRRSATGTAVYDEAPGEPGVPEETRRALPEREDRFGLYERERRGTGRRWLRVGLVTGIVAFLVGATVVTASELTIFGGSVGGGDRRTTYFGGGKEKRATDVEKQREQRQVEESTTPVATPTPGPEEPEEAATPAPEETPEAPDATPTPTPAQTPPPAPTPPPVEEDPAAP